MKLAEKLLYQDDKDCRPDGWAVLKDAGQTALYLLCTYGVNFLREQLLKSELNGWDQIVVGATSIVFAFLALRMVVNSFRCLLRMVARTTYEGKQYIDLIAERDTHKARSSSSKRNVK